MDVRRFRTNRTWDIILWSDGPEHLEKLEALDVISKAEEWGQRVIISTPLGYMAQTDIDGNLANFHRSCWEPWELEAWGYKTEVLDYVVVSAPKIFRPFIRAYNYLRMRPQRQIIAWKG